MLELNLKVPWKFTLESKFTTAWLKEIRNKGWFAYKLSDGSLWQKPFDAIVTTNKGTYFIELKVVNKDIFNISRFWPSQLKSLRLTNSLWSNAIVLVYSKTYNRYKIFSFDKIKNLDSSESVKLIF